ncbi:MAG: Asp-tRNA(Asn)/Glu-tRNA(Gln) amidotransferase subunit GatC [Candidatus Eremiobacterota bacterium]
MGRRRVTGHRLSLDEVDHVAHLARLEITAAEREAFARQLADILGYIDQLQELPTEGVEPQLAVLKRTNVFREDEERSPLGLEGVLQNAPERVDGQFRIPRILEET